MPTKSKYKLAVEHYRTYPEEIWLAWRRPHRQPMGCLFQLCSPDGWPHRLENGQRIGCPVMVKSSPEYAAWTRELTDEIKASDLPSCASRLKEAHVIWLAKLQAHMDRTIRNELWRKQLRYTATVSRSLWMREWWEE